MLACCHSQVKEREVKRRGAAQTAVLYMHKNKCNFTRFTNKTMFPSNANQAVMWEKKQNTSCCPLLLLECFCKSCSVVSIAVGSFGKGISRQTLEQGHSTGGPQSITSPRKKYVQGICMPWIVVHKVATQAWAIRKKRKERDTTTTTIYRDCNINSSVDKCLWGSYEISPTLVSPIIKTVLSVITSGEK